MNVGSLFSGIGGLDLGLERAGMRVLWQCESDPYCRAVLRRHWPDSQCFPDVRALIEAPSVDLICGGFPCQPFSMAGRRRGLDDERWLWPEFHRVVRVLRPRYVLVENVPGLLARHGGMGNVLGDLASSGYDAEWDCISAAAVGANHRRDRVWIVAHADTKRRSQRWLSEGERKQGLSDVARCSRSSTDSSRQGNRRSDLADTDQARRPLFSGSEARAELDGLRASRGGGWWSSEPDVGRVADGVPKRMDRVGALGNAVVPQVAEWIGRRILEAEEEQTCRVA